MTSAVSMSLGRNPALVAEVVVGATRASGIRVEPDAGGGPSLKRVTEERWVGIGELARVTGTTVRAVRYYEQVGLLARPSRSSGGHRRYHSEERTRLLQILALRDLDVPLGRIRDIVQGRDPSALLAVLRDHRDVLVERREALADALIKLDRLLASSPASDSAPSESWDEATAFTLMEGIAMSIALTRIYTRTGDDGTTGLAGTERVSKTDPVIEVIGAVDELCAAIGMAIPHATPPIRSTLRRIQNELFDVGADLATPDHDDAADRAPVQDDQTFVGGGTPVPSGDAEGAAIRIGSAYVGRLEAECDTFNEHLPSLRSFVLPGHSSPGSELHFARAVCRRAERRAWAADDQISPLIPHYLNRLSDLLFILARASTPGPEPLWAPTGAGAD